MTTSAHFLAAIFIAFASSSDCLISAKPPPSLVRHKPPPSYKPPQSTPPPPQQSVPTLPNIRPPHAPNAAPAKCGPSWQADYAKLHRDILSGRAPQRYLVFVAPLSGLADKLVAFPSLLLWAMLSKRALVTVQPYDFPAWGDIFDFPNINLTAPSGFNVVYDEKQEWCNKAANERPDRHHLCWLHFSTNHLRSLERLNMTSYLHHVKNIYIQTNRGVSHAMFSNPYHKEQFQAWGLTPETGFSCAMEYLFKEKESSCDSTCQRLRRSVFSAREQGKAVIGVQVRVGDTVMNSGSDNTSLSIATNHFKCASNIANDLFISSGTQSVFYFLSDSLSLVHTVIKVYGDKVITDSETKPVHVGSSCNRGGKCYDKDEKTLFVRQTVNRLILFSLTDYQVVSELSGFGMMAAWMNRARPIEHRIYRVLEGNINCSYNAYSNVIWDISSLAHGYSGIR